MNWREELCKEKCGIDPDFVSCKCECTRVIIKLDEYEQHVEQLQKALGHLIHLHQCEQEGMEIPKPDEWIEAVKDAEKHVEVEYIE